MHRTAHFLLGGFLCLTLLGCSRGPKEPRTAENLPAAPPTTYNPSPWIMPVVSCPPVRTAATANLPDDARVVGVVVDGKARAYLLKAMCDTSRHVLNDLLANRPVILGAGRNGTNGLWSRNVIS